MVRIFMYLKWYGLPYSKFEKVTYYVGKIKSKCKESGACKKEDLSAIDAFRWSPTKVYNHEKLTTYPARYPMNSDSIGIEVIGKYKKPKDVKTEYNLKNDDIYSHDIVSYKTKGDGTIVYDALRIK